MVAAASESAEDGCNINEYGKMAAAASESVEDDCSIRECRR
jgi:hypothetical protein